MTDQKGLMGRVQGGFLGSLRDALAAASRDDTQRGPDLLAQHAPQLEAPAAPVANAADVAATQLMRKEAPLPPAAEAVREARAGAPNVPPLARAEVVLDVDEAAAPTTRVVRPQRAAAAERDERTQVLRGKPKVARGEFEQDPVVGWLVVVGGPGSVPSARSSRATTPSVAALLSASRSTSATMRSRPRSRPTSAMTVPNAASCSCPILLKPTSSP